MAYLLGRGMTWSMVPVHEDRIRDRMWAEEVEQALYGVGRENHVDAVVLQGAQNASVLGDDVNKVI
jgi:hypothetical protein